MTNGTPPAEHLIDEQLVRQLLREQHPDLAEDAMHLLDVGWDNASYRLGSKYVVRLPRRALAAELIQREQTWLPVLADRLPIAIPSPVRVGQPNRVYPWPWSIVPWLPGITADLAPPLTSQSRVLSEFLTALHRPAPAAAPRSEVRGVPLRLRFKTVQDRLDRLSDSSGLITSALRGAWQGALEAAVADEACWIHGDLHARNVLVESGFITGILDWGDITSGDVATDLAAVWMLLPDAKARADCLSRYQADRDLIARAKGWAIHFGTVLLETGQVDHPRHAAMGEATLRRIHEDLAGA